jgi:hypothetical protein
VATRILTIAASAAAGLMLFSNAYAGAPQVYNANGQPLGYLEFKADTRPQIESAFTALLGDPINHGTKIYLLYYHANAVPPGNNKQIPGGLDFNDVIYYANSDCTGGPGMILPEGNTSPMPAYVDNLQQIWTYDPNAMMSFIHKSYSYTDPTIGHAYYGEGNECPQGCRTQGAPAVLLGSAANLERRAVRG